MKICNCFSLLGSANGIKALTYNICSFDFWCDGGEQLFLRQFIRSPCLSVDQEIFIASSLSGKAAFRLGNGISTFRCARVGSSLSVLAYSVVGEGLSVRCSVALGTSSFKVIMHDRSDGLHDMEGGGCFGQFVHPIDSRIWRKGCFGQLVHPIEEPPQIDCECFTRMFFFGRGHAGVWKFDSELSEARR